MESISNAAPMPTGPFEIAAVKSRNSESEMGSEARPHAKIDEVRDRSPAKF